MFSPKEFINIGNTISKYTHPLDNNLEEHQIGVTIPSEEEGLLGEGCELLEAAPIHELLEGNTLELQYFQDGIQRTQFLGNIFSEQLKRLVPLIFTTVGAIVVSLEGGHIRKYFEPIMEEKFIVPDLQYLPAELVASIPKKYLYEVKGFDPERPPNEFRKYIFTNIIRKMRQRVEVEMVQQFDRQNPEDWLVIDGLVYQVSSNDKKVGIIKRHGKDWIDPELKFRILKEFVQNDGRKLRSCLFKITYRTPFHAVMVSSYAKLLYQFKSPLTNNPEFSLIRIETPLTHKDEFDPILNTILQLNSPLSNPSDQWDKKIYPIYMAEKILRSYSKNDRIISAAFHRMWYKNDGR